MEIKEKLKKIIYEAFDFDESLIDIEKINFLEDIGMDSLMFIDLLSSIELEFSITIPDEMLMANEFDTFNKIYEKIIMLLDKGNVHETK